MIVNETYGLLTKGGGRKTAVLGWERPLMNEQTKKIYEVISCKR